MKHKPDDRRDNVDKIQNNIDHTIANMEAAEEMIAESDDPGVRKDLKAKNVRRAEALDDMRREIRDEAIDKKHQYRKQND